jgi:hypothetical protein
MSDQPKTRSRLLELNRETIQDLTGTEADQVIGGAPTTVLTVSGECPPTGAKYARQSLDTCSPACRDAGQTAICGFQK